jgi:hypothetical protein
MKREDADPIVLLGKCAVAHPNALATMVHVRPDDADEAVVAIAAMPLAATVADGLGVVGGEVSSGVNETVLAPLLPLVGNGVQHVYFCPHLRLHDGSRTGRSARACACKGDCDE